MESKHEPALPLVTSTGRTFHGLSKLEHVALHIYTSLSLDPSKRDNGKSAKERTAKAFEEAEIFLDRSDQKWIAYLVGGEWKIIRWEGKPTARKLWKEDRTNFYGFFRGYAAVDIREQIATLIARAELQSHSRATNRFLKLKD